MLSVIQGKYSTAFCTHFCNFEWTGFFVARSPQNVDNGFCDNEYCRGLEEFDGNYDSDEDADFTKMDMVMNLF